MRYYTGMHSSKKSSAISCREKNHIGPQEEKELMILRQAARQAAEEARIRAEQLDKEKTKKLVNQMIKEALHS